ncbi:hypothetical protein [Streptomyces tibetensis]|uniref:hypothetical protein n=1 Tax=Streptomyces tibetensis TaxID=2382123 RepID=UPI0033D7CBDE
MRAVAVGWLGKSALHRAASQVSGGGERGVDQSVQSRGHGWVGEDPARTEAGDGVSHSDPAVLHHQRPGALPWGSAWAAWSRAWVTRWPR